MSVTADTDRFFQTDVSLAARARRETKVKNDNGNPIRMSSKLLALLADPKAPSRFYVSDSAGEARRVDLASRSTKHVFKGASAPLPCLALSANTKPILYAGSWDRAIYSWNTETREPHIAIANAHGDFVKCLAFANLMTPGRNSGLSILISGGADKVIRIWDGDTGDQLSVLRGHSMGVLSIALEPGLTHCNPTIGEMNVRSSATHLTFLSASSDREIRRWSVSVTGSPDTDADPLIETSKLQFVGPQSDPREALTPLPTSINQIVFTLHDSLNDSAPHTYEICLVACSASGDIALLTHSSQFTGQMAQFSHGEQNGVRAIAVNSDGTLLASGGRDEDIWLWSLEQGEQVGKWRGHADEVTGLAWTEGPGGQHMLVSVSLDGTIRSWSMDKGEDGWLEAGVEDDTASAQMGNESEPHKHLDENVADKPDVMLTADEEAELAELMDED